MIAPVKAAQQGSPDRGNNAAWQVDQTLHDNGQFPQAGKELLAPCAVASNEEPMSHSEDPAGTILIPVLHCSPGQTLCR